MSRQKRATTLIRDVSELDGFAGSEFLGTDRQVALIDSRSDAVDGIRQDAANFNAESSKLGQDVRIDVVEVKRSLRQLEVDSESVVRDPTTLETREKLGVIGSRVDIRSNSIVLIATRVTEEVSRWVASSYPGASVELGEAPQPKEACDNLHCWPLSGGTAYRSSAPGQPLDPNVLDACSFGIPMQRVGSSDLLMLTAGHCLDTPARYDVHAFIADNTFANIDTLVGSREVASYGGTSCDCALIQMGDQFLANYLFADPGDRQNEVEDWATIYSISVNASVCKAGFSSGRTCGMVLATFVSSGQASNIVTNTIKSNATAIGGDSGGPLLYTFNEGTVLGVLSGGASGPPDQPNYWSSLSYVSSVLGTNVVPYTSSDHDRAFLITLYDRALHRGPDGPGFGAWLGALTSPCSATTVGFVADQFYRSGELKAGTPLTSYPGVQARMRRAYRGFLGREPDAAGWASWSNYVFFGDNAQREYRWDVTSVAFKNSIEFLGRAFQATQSERPLC